MPYRYRSTKKKNRTLPARPPRCQLSVGFCWVGLSYTGLLAMCMGSAVRLRTYVASCVHAHFSVAFFVILAIQSCKEGTLLFRSAQDMMYVPSKNQTCNMNNTRDSGEWKNKISVRNILPTDEHAPPM